MTERSQKAVQYLEEARCELCGRYGAYELTDHRLCEECYQLPGSCCLEFGADDLWEVD